MKLLFLFTTFLIFNCNISFSQKTKVETGEAIIMVETSMSEDQTLNKARQLAQINAIENAFGRIVVQGNSTFILNSTTGQKIETNNTFNFISDSYVNGEWIETLDEKVEKYNQPDGNRWVKITIKGKIRELKNLEYSCEAYTLSCPKLTCKCTEYNNGQGLYVYFKSPKDGYVSIYFDDPYEQITSRILPYSQSKNGVAMNFPVKADSSYYLFSSKHDYLKDSNNIDELELTAKTPLDHYKIYVFYSPLEFDKPLLNDMTQQVLDANAINAKYTLPPSLPSEQFQKWQIILRGKNPEIEMQTIMINVKKN